MSELQKQMQACDTNLVKEEVKLASALRRQTEISDLKPHSRNPVCTFNIILI
jgi:hypothetical protein